MRQIPVLFGVIEAVADDEAILDREADVFDRHVHAPRDGLLSRQAVRSVRGLRARRMSCR